jgi:hypothetical protein
MQAGNLVDLSSYRGKYGIVTLLPCLSAGGSRPVSVSDVFQPREVTCKKCKRQAGFG